LQPGQLLQPGEEALQLPAVSGEHQCTDEQGSAGPAAERLLPGLVSGQRRLRWLGFGL